MCAILTAHGSFPTAVQAIKQGAYDYLTKPFDNEQLLFVVKRGLELARLSSKVNELEQVLRKKQGVDAMIGDSPAVQDLRRQIRRIADTDTTVLIEGESGAGKELVARAIHFESPRCKQPLVVVDGAAVPSALLESEFFGHEKGAFTDAADRRIGKFGVHACRGERAHRRGCASGKSASHVGSPLPTQISPLLKSIPHSPISTLAQLLR